MKSFERWLLMEIRRALVTWKISFDWNKLSLVLSCTSHLINWYFMLLAYLLFSPIMCSYIINTSSDLVNFWPSETLFSSHFSLLVRWFLFHWFSLICVYFTKSLDAFVQQLYAWYKAKQSHSIIQAPSCPLYHIPSFYSLYKKKVLCITCSIHCICIHWIQLAWYVWNFCYCFIVLPTLNKIH